MIIRTQNICDEMILEKYILIYQSTDYVLEINQRDLPLSLNVTCSPSCLFLLAKIYSLVS